MLASRSRESLDPGKTWQHASGAESRSLNWKQEAGQTKNGERVKNCLSPCLMMYFLQQTST